MLESGPSSLPGYVSNISHCPKGDSVVAMVPRHSNKIHSDFQSFNGPLTTNSHVQGSFLFKMFLFRSMLARSRKRSPTVCVLL